MRKINLQQHVLDWETTANTLLTSNKGMKYIMKIGKSFKEYGFLIEDNN